MTCPLLLSLTDAARLLGVSRDVLREEIAEGRIGVLMVRSQPRVPRAELERYARGPLVLSRRANLG